jgi:ADP-heptose:LPS heptosyltransferase
MKRLLVIRFGALGDLIHASPALGAIKRTYPDMELHLLTSPGYRALAGMLPGVDRVWSWEKKQGWPALFKLALQWRQIGITDVVNLHPSFKSLLITGLLWPVNSAVYRKQKLALKGLGQRDSMRRHAAEDFFQPFGRLFNIPAPEAFLPALKKHALPSHLPIKPQQERWLAIIPGVGAKRSNRAWLPASYIQLMQDLLVAQADLKILLIGGPDESVLAQQLCSAWQEGFTRVENHCGQYDIPGTASLLSQCDLVVGGDTGPIHLAAATGVSVLGIYGPTALARTGPLTRQSLSPMLTPPDGLACWPCELPECPYTGEAYLACMKQIEVSAVKEAVLSLLNS